MSFLKLAVSLAVLALVPLAAAQAPPPSTYGKIAITNVGPVSGLIKDDGKDVIPFKGNVTVPVSVSIDCSLIAYEVANKKASDINHFHVQPADKLPSWLVADELLTYFPNVVPGQDTTGFPVSGCQGGSGTYMATVQYPFAVTAAAPAVATHTLNLTANLGDDAYSDPVAVTFAVQFHANYTITPSVQFPLTVTGKTANFTVAISNNANARSMVMLEGLHASAGSISGLTSTVYVPPETKTFQVTFKAPDGCWSTATVEFKAFSHYLLLTQEAGSFKGEKDVSWEFQNGVACKGGTSSKASPLNGWVLIASVLGAALVARRRFA